jgi:putative FmdB family regulatory protein
MSPIYCYQCPDCGWSIDINEPIESRDEGPMCGDCLRVTKRMVSNVSAIFKGTGWGSSK